MQAGHVRGGAQLGQPPPAVQQKLHRLFPALLRLGDPPAVQRGVDSNDVQLGRLLHLGRARGRRQQILDALPVVLAPGRVQLQLGVVHRAREVAHQLPLVELLRRLEPIRLPKTQLRLGHARDLPRARALHAAEKHILRLLPVPVLREREADARHLAVAPLPPQPHKHVLLAEQPVQLGERVEAPRLLRVPHDVVLQKRDGDVPRVVRLA